MLKPLSAHLKSGLFLNLDWRTINQRDILIANHKSETIANETHLVGSTNLDNLRGRGARLALRPDRARESVLDSGNAHNECAAS